MMQPSFSLNTNSSVTVTACVYSESYSRYNRTTVCRWGFLIPVTVKPAALLHSLGELLCSDLVLVLFCSDIVGLFGT